MSSKKIVNFDIPRVSSHLRGAWPQLWSLASHNPAEIKAISRIRCDTARDAGIAISTNS